MEQTTTSEMNIDEDEMQEVLTISTEEGLEEILRNTDENCTIIIVDENCNVQHDYTETNYIHCVWKKKISVGETITYTASPVSNENHQVRDEQDGDDQSKNGRSRKRKRQP